MADIDLKKNGEKYNDPTPYKAFGTINEGEIYTKGDKELLIVRSHERFCNVLTLLDESYADDDCIEVRSRSLKYTNPAMLSYLFKTTITGEFVKKLPDSEFQKVIQAVGNAMNITKEVVKEVTVSKPESVSKESIYKEMCAELLEKILKKALE